VTLVNGSFYDGRHGVKTGVKLGLGLFSDIRGHCNSSGGGNSLRTVCIDWIPNMLVTDGCFNSLVVLISVLDSKS
jgi:hypothetical protein